MIEEVVEEEEEEDEAEEEDEEEEGEVGPLLESSYEGEVSLLKSHRVCHNYPVKEICIPLCIGSSTNRTRRGTSLCIYVGSATLLNVRDQMSAHITYLYARISI